jgi:5-methylcytosine-specific restriction protein A
MPNRVPYASNVPEGLTVARPNDRQQAESKAERDEFYNRARWRTLRAEFLKRSPVCVDCLERNEVTPATIPHHVQERLARPDLAYSWSNLVALCNQCHTSRHKAKDCARSPGGEGKSPSRPEPSR